MTHEIKEFSERTSPQTHHFHNLHDVSAEWRQTVVSQLKQRGADAYDLWLPETNYLPHLLHEDETIMGSVYGRYKSGRGMLVATDQRVLFLDKKPMFMHVDELTFMNIGGVTFTKSLFLGYVSVHSRLGDYKLRTFNLKNAANFVDYIEMKCLQAMMPYEGKFDNVT